MHNTRFSNLKHAGSVHYFWVVDKEEVQNTEDPEWLEDDYEDFEDEIEDIEIDVDDDNQSS